MDVALLGAAFGALFVGHQVGDHWVQTSVQAARKGLPGWAGRRACLAHVATYTVTLAATVSPLGVDWRRLAVALLVSAVTHYFADRRTPLHRLAEMPGSGEFWTLGVPRPGRDDNPTLGTGAYALDQSWHMAWLWVCALILAA